MREQKEIIAKDGIIKKRRTNYVKMADTDMGRQMIWCAAVAAVLAIMIIFI